MYYEWKTEPPQKDGVYLITVDSKLIDDVKINHEYHKSIFVDISGNSRIVLLHSFYEGFGWDTNSTKVEDYLLENCAIAYCDITNLLTDETRGLYKKPSQRGDYIVIFKNSFFDENLDGESIAISHYSEFYDEWYPSCILGYSIIESETTKRFSENIITWYPLLRPYAWY